MTSEENLQKKVYFAQEHAVSQSKPVTLATGGRSKVLECGFKDWGIKSNANLCKTADQVTRRLTARYRYRRRESRERSSISIFTSSEPEDDSATRLIKKNQLSLDKSLSGMDLQVDHSRFGVRKRYSNNLDMAIHRLNASLQRLKVPDRSSTALGRRMTMASTYGGNHPLAMDSPQIDRVGEKIKHIKKELNAFYESEGNLLRDTESTSGRRGTILLTTGGPCEIIKYTEKEALKARQEARKARKRSIKPWIQDLTPKKTSTSKKQPISSKKKAEDSYKPCIAGMKSRKVVDKDDRRKHGLSTHFQENLLGDSPSVISDTVIPTRKRFMSSIDGRTGMFQYCWSKSVESPIVNYVIPGAVRLRPLATTGFLLQGQRTTATDDSDYDLLNTEAETEMKKSLMHKIYDVYTTSGRRKRRLEQMRSSLGRLSCESSPGLSPDMKQLFRSHRVPLTTENIISFFHDAGVFVMESGSRRGKPISLTHRKISPHLVQQPHLLSQIAGPPAFQLHRGGIGGESEDFKPWEGICDGTEFPIIPTMEERVRFFKYVDKGHVLLEPVTADRRMKEFQRDFYRRMHEAEQKRTTNKYKHLWWIAYRRVQCMLRICRTMASRTMGMELQEKTFVDIGDNSVVPISYGTNERLDLEYFRRRDEITISPDVKDILNSPPKGRTLVQLEVARRELQKVEVFSNFPITVQERTIRRAFYLEIGPKRCIVRQGQMPQHFYLIICGEASVKLREVGPDGQVLAKACGFMHKGMVFGGLSLISNTQRTSSVISRTNMQLLALNGEDYLDIFVYPPLRKDLGDHLVYLSKMNFMEGFPINLLKEKHGMCTQHHYRRNTVISPNSRTCDMLFVIKYGYCKVFGRLQEGHDESHDRKFGTPTPQSAALNLEPRPSFSYCCAPNTSPATNIKTKSKFHYIEGDSPYVHYVETKTPLGKRVRVPITRKNTTLQKIQNLPLTMPKKPRQFVPLLLLREGDIFGMDQTELCPNRSKSNSVILVSLGAELIALNKEFFCQNVSKEGKELIEKTLIFDKAFIKRKLGERANRDVHLEEVLSHYFARADDNIYFPHKAPSKMFQ